MNVCGFRATRLPPPRPGRLEYRDCGISSRSTGSLGDSILYLSLIELQNECGDFSGALFAEAVSVYPNHLTLQWFAARLAVERGDIEVAQPILEKLMAIDAETFFEPQLAYDKALFRHIPAQALALGHFRDGRFDEASRLYRIAAQTAPDANACYLKARLAELRLSARGSAPRSADVPMFASQWQ